MNTHRQAASSSQLAAAHATARRSSSGGRPGSASRSATRWTPVGQLVAVEEGHVVGPPADDLDGAVAGPW